MQSYMLSQANHYGAEKAQELGRRMWIGHAALAVERLQKYLGVVGDDIEAIAKILQLHPHFQPRSYVDLRVALTGPRTVRVEIGDCPALREETQLSWFRQLGEEPHPALEALVQRVNPRARVRAADPGDATLAWEVEIQPRAEPADEPQELQLARLSGGMTFRFEQRRLLRA
jgi:hypothetical protein